jgi:hypothetical protein
MISQIVYDDTLSHFISFSNYNLKKYVGAFLNKKKKTD